MNEAQDVLRAHGPTWGRDVRVVRRRAATYVGVAALVAGAFVVLGGAPGWRAVPGHAALEAVATAMAGIIGALALVRYYSRKNNAFLFLGTGFLATAALDATHTLAAPFAGGGGIVDWSWLASRTMLGAFFGLNWLGWRRERRLGQGGRVGEAPVYLATAILAGATVLALLTVGAPQPGGGAGPIPRPGELLPAALFLVALVGYLRKGHWRDNAFDHWLVLSLLLGLAADVPMMAWSAAPFDARDAAAHALKAASYLAVLIGLLISVYKTFRQAEESAEALAIEVVERERATRAKSEFLAVMSHELRTPLNSVIGFTTVLLKTTRGSLAERETTFLERIRENGLHLLRLINDVLDLSKIEAGKMDLSLEEVRLDELVRETIGEFRGAALDGAVDLRIETPTALAPIETDRGKLKQVLINLVGNAMKFTERGAVTIRVTADPRTAEPRCVEVSDTGIGIPADRLKAIFEAFEQADSGTARSYGGTGLGLTISSQLCRLLGYVLEVESRVGEGSTFRVVLDPATAGPELAPRTSGTPEAGTPVVAST